jgi:hypothetical protein
MSRWLAAWWSCRARSPRPARPGARPQDPARILIAHHLLLGDTLMLAALLARLRRRYPARHDRHHGQPRLPAPVRGRPYGANAVPWDPHSPGLTRAVTRRGPYDLALVPGENRHALLARAAGARWVVALDHDTPGWKNRIVDELGRPARTAESRRHSPAWPGPVTRLLRPATGPAPACGTHRDRRPLCGFARGRRLPLALLAGRALARARQHLAGRGLRVVWSAGPGEEALVEPIDPDRRHRSLAGKLDLAQLWHLLAGAALLVVPDTGVAHLAKLTATPTVCLFGPGSDVLFGPGRYWRAQRFTAVIAPDFHAATSAPCSSATSPGCGAASAAHDRCAGPGMHACARPRARRRCLRPMLLAPCRENPGHPSPLSRNPP